MTKTKKIWQAVFWLLVIAAAVNGGYFYVASEAMGNSNLEIIATILTPVLSAFNYIVAGFAAGLGFYLAKELVGK